MDIPLGVPLDRMILGPFEGVLCWCLSSAESENSVSRLFCLVVYIYIPTPLKNIWVRQLGWWHSQYIYIYRYIYIFPIYPNIYSQYIFPIYPNIYSQYIPIYIPNISQYIFPMYIPNHQCFSDAFRPAESISSTMRHMPTRSRAATLAFSSSL